MLEPIQSSARFHEGHDEGLAHDHAWAAGAARVHHASPQVSDPRGVATPSCALHDDLHYAF